MSVQKFVVSRDDSIYEAWPDVAMASNGDLVCVFTECRHHGNRDLSRLCICRSSDRGRTWSKKDYLTKQGKKDAYYNCARISNLGPDELIIVCDFDEGPNENDAVTRIDIWKSSDNGLTWNGPVSTPATGIVPDKYHVLQNGRHILSSHSYNHETKKLEQHLWFSDNQGKTWNGPVTVAKHPDLNLCEGSILETPEGALVCFLRENSNRGYDCFKTISYDSGETWSDVIHVPIPCCHRPVAGYLANGEIMVTHRFMHGGKGWVGSWTQNVFAAFLKADQILCDSRNQQSCRIFPLDYDRSPVSDLGYTGWVQFPDGEIYVVNYIVDNAPAAQIRGYSFRYEDVVLPAASDEN